MHIETEGAHRGALWTEWHCEHCLIISRYAQGFNGTLDDLNRQMMEIDPIRNPPVDEHTELINLLEPPFLPISGRTIAEILCQFAE